MQTIWRASTLAVLSLAAAANAVAADIGPPLAEQARLANRRFQDAAAALAEGYVAIPCVDGADGAVAAMHYVNARYLKDEVPTIGRPQALMYEAADDGHLDLVAVEYIAFKGPTWLEGQSYHFIAAPNRYGLRPFYDLLVWTAEPDPRGMLADKSPNFSCEEGRRSPPP